jgi:hypothetical protein
VRVAAAAARGPSEKDAGRRGLPSSYPRLHPSSLSVADAPTRASDGPLSERRHEKDRAGVQSRSGSCIRPPLGLTHLESTPRSSPTILRAAESGGGPFRSRCFGARFDRVASAPKGSASVTSASNWRRRRTPRRAGPRPPRRARRLKDALLQAGAARRRWSKGAKGRTVVVAKELLVKSERVAVQPRAQLRVVGVRRSDL